MAETSTVPVKHTNGTLARTPFGLLDDFGTELERFWHRPWSFWTGPLARPFAPFTREPIAWAPRVDVYDKDGTIVIKAELPGLKKEDVQVEIVGDDLVIRGESKAETEVKEEDYYRSERTFGSFYRRMPLPAGTSAEQVEATLNHGVLEVRIPKPTEPKEQSHTVPVK